MIAKWGRFGAFIVAACLIVTAVVLGTGNTTRSWGLVALQAVLIAVGVYATTFIVWPRSLFRRTRVAVLPDHEIQPVVPASDDLVADGDQADDPAHDGPESVRTEAPRPDERPVAVIQPRPPGSKPGSRVHIPENPTVRNPRGRRLGGHEPSKDFRWPAQR